MNRIIKLQHRLDDQIDFTKYTLVYINLRNSKTAYRMTQKFKCKKQSAVSSFQSTRSMHHKKIIDRYNFACLFLYVTHDGRHSQRGLRNITNNAATLAACAVRRRRLAAGRMRTNNAALLAAQAIGRAAADRLRMSARHGV